MIEKLGTICVILILSQQVRKSRNIFKIQIENLKKMGLRRPPITSPFCLLWHIKRAKGKWRYKVSVLCKTLKEVKLDEMKVSHDFFISMYTLTQGQERPQLPPPECGPPTPPSPGQALLPTSPTWWPRGMYYREDLRCTLDKNSTQGIECGRLVLDGNQPQQTQRTDHRRGGCLVICADPSSFLLEVS